MFIDYKTFFSRRTDAYKVFFYSIVNVIVYYILYAWMKKLLYSFNIMLSELFGLLIIPTSNYTAVVSTVLTNIVVTIISGLSAGLITAIIFLKKFKNAFIVSIVSGFLFVLLSYIKIIVRYEKVWQAPDLGILISYLLNPLIAGLSLTVSILLLNRIRKVVLRKN